MKKQYLEKHKWHQMYLFGILFSILMVFNGAIRHPIYLSVVNIEENKKDHTLEITCKIFTNDFEAALRKNNPGKIDLLHPKDKAQMELMVNRYIQQHLKISVNTIAQKMLFLGYEQNEDAIESYFQINCQAPPTEIAIEDNILYDVQKDQISVVHVTINGNRKSNKLTNPDDKIELKF